MGKSNIQWTDFSFNGWIGCRKVADECKNCYAETLDRNRFSKTMPGCSKESPISHWGSGPRYRTSANNWKDPVKWNKAAPTLFVQCTVCGRREMRGWDGIGLTCCSTKGCVSLPETDAEPVRPRVFCASLSDWLDDENVPIEWLADLLKLIYSTPNLDWLLLSKRPQNWMNRMVKVMKHNEDSGGDIAFFEWLLGWVVCQSIGAPPANIWIGVSAGADQAAALQIPTRIHFLSCEPMLRPMDETHAARFDWIIFGGESGSKARELDIQWIRDGLLCCQMHEITPFVKQLGSNPVYKRGDVPFIIRDSHGADMSEWPEDLRVREFPRV